MSSARMTIEEFVGLMGVSNSWVGDVGGREIDEFSIFWEVWMFDFSSGSPSMHKPSKLILILNSCHSPLSLNVTLNDHNHVNLCAVIKDWLWFIMKS